MNKKELICKVFHLKGGISALRNLVENMQINIEKLEAQKDLLERQINSAEQ